MRTPDDRPAGESMPDEERADLRDEYTIAADAGDEIDEVEAVEPTAVGTGLAEDADALRRELAAQQDKYLRLAAEFDNFRRRTQRERMEAGARAQAELVKPLLDTLDDLERFGQVEPATATAQSMIDAVTMVGRKLAKALGGAGLEVVNPAGEPFDPARHEAVATAPAASADEDSTVAVVYQLGYVFGGQLLRPARVVVRQWNG